MIMISIALYYNEDKKFGLVKNVQIPFFLLLIHIIIQA